jgi:PAS domain-containing protein
VATDYVFWSAVQPDGRLELHWVAGAFENITGLCVRRIRRARRVAGDGPSRRPGARRARLETLRANRPLRSELRTLAKDGRTVWVEVAAHPVWDEKRQRLAGIYGAVKGRHPAQAGRSRSAGDLRDAEPVRRFRAGLRRLRRRRGALSLRQSLPRKLVQGFPPALHRPQVEEVHRPSTYAIMRPYSRRALAGESVRYEHEMTGRDGKYYCFDVQYVPRRASDGTVLGYFSLVFDVTERVLRDRQLLRTQRLESVGRLASGIAHDLNNILAPMLMGPDLLLETVRSPAERKCWN